MVGAASGVVATTEAEATGRNTAATFFGTTAVIAALADTNGVAAICTSTDHARLAATSAVTGFASSLSCTGNTEIASCTSRLTLEARGTLDCIGRFFGTLTKLTDALTVAGRAILALVVSSTTADPNPADAGAGSTVSTVVVAVAGFEAEVSYSLNTIAAATRLTTTTRLAGRAGCTVGICAGAGLIAG